MYSRDAGSDQKETLVIDTTISAVIFRLPSTVVFGCGARLFEQFTNSGCTLSRLISATGIEPLTYLACLRSS